MTDLLRWVLAFALLSGCGPARDEPPRLMVFAAASLRDVMLEQAAEFRQLGGEPITFNFAGSNVLALQLEASPRSADVFLSANAYWMDHLSDAEVVTDISRVDFLSNRLVVVAASDSPLVVAKLSDIASPAVEFLALGNPDAVPAGRYARAALEEISLRGGTLWDLVEGRIAPAADVRGALALVEARPDTLGIVYRTDASSSERVRALLEIPPSPSSPIVYTAAVLRQTQREPQASAFVRFLGSPQAEAIFERHGFEMGNGVVHG